MSSPVPPVSPDTEREGRGSPLPLEAHILVVEDDGRGAGGRRECNGLRGLRERVAQAGGETEIGVGAHGRGTRLEVRL